MNPCERFARLFVLVYVAVIVPAGDASAATYTWLGTAGNNNWFSSGLTLSSNWNPSGFTLGPDDSLVFGTPGFGGSDTPNQNGDAQITNLISTGDAHLEWSLGSSSNSTLTISGSLVHGNNYGLYMFINNPVQFVTGAVVNAQASDIVLGVLTGSGNFTKIGGSYLELTDASAFSGTMTISNGPASAYSSSFGGSIVNDNGFFYNDTSVAGSYVQSGVYGVGYLGSVGSVEQTGGVIRFSSVSGTVSGSSTLDGVNDLYVDIVPVGGTVTFGEALVLGGSNSTTFRVAGPGVADKYVVNGGLTYGGTMNINFTTSGSQANGTTWSVFDPLGGVSGTFAAITGTGQAPYASLAWGLAATSANYYDQKYGEGIWLSSWTGSGTSSQRLIFNQATGDITVVPEPSTFVMAAAGIGGYSLLRWRRGRRRASEASESKGLPTG